MVLLFASAAFGGTAPVAPAAPAPIPVATVTTVLPPNAPPPANPVIKTNAAGGKELWVDTPHGQQKLGDIQIVPAGTKYYHWADPVDSARWAKQGYISSGEVAVLDDGSGMVGGGFYASKAINDSSGFGPNLTVLTTTGDATALMNIQYTNGYYPDWDTLNQQLIKLGIDAIGNYNGGGTWFNFFDAKDLGSAHAGTWADMEASDYFKTVPQSIASILMWDRSLPVQDTPLIQQNFPTIHQLLQGNLDVSTLDIPTRNSILDWLKGTDSSFHTPLANAVRTKFSPLMAPYLKAAYATALAPPPVMPAPVVAAASSAGQAVTPPATTPRPLTDAQVWGGVGNTIDQGMMGSQAVQIPYSAWLPAGVPVQEPPDVFPYFNVSSTGMFLQNRPTGQFAVQMNMHLPYLNWQDFLTAAANGKDITTIYDTTGMPPYQTRWQSAQTQAMMNGPLTVNKTMTNDPSADFRDGPAGSDGDITWKGKTYFQVNARQKAALQGNPFINAEFQTIPDPANSGQTIQVARYDYPTAADFEKFKGFLPDADYQAFSAAKAAGTFADMTTPAARALTKQMLTDLLQALCGNGFLATNPVFPTIALSHADYHQFFLSLHPFSSMNAETAAVIMNNGFALQKGLYFGLRTLPGKPDEALLYSQLDYHAQLMSNQMASQAIQKAFLREEAASPQFPQYFSVPEIWQQGLLLRGDYAGAANVGSDPAAFVARVRSSYQTAPASTVNANCVANTVLGKPNGH